jgi:WD40 repeat protein/serine/threonine protein kinase
MVSFALLLGSIKEVWGSDYWMAKIVIYRGWLRKQKKRSFLFMQSQQSNKYEWRIGDHILNLYHIVDILGEGGMGKVYKVHHQNWNVDLAVKSPHPQIFTRGGGKENFIREAETWIKLDLHPHIVSCYYVRVIDDIPRIFAEYVEGSSLANWIRQRRLYEARGPEALARILDIAIQFAWGLEAAHAQRLVHQDIKPANLMVTAEGIAKVTDFGLARAGERSEEPSTTGSQADKRDLFVTSRGMTPAYCSPEQAARKPLNHKTDIWSWAVSVLEMFTSEVTWISGTVAGEALADYLQQGQHDPALPLMPPSLAHLLSSCLQVQPDQRPTSMAEIAWALLTIYQQEVGQTYPREIPNLVRLRAGALNNRALSLCDLGKEQEARQVWGEALQADPQHLETIYNWHVLSWQGFLTDAIALRQVEIVRQAQQNQVQALILLAQIHLARRDIDSAQDLLEQVTRQAPENTEAQTLLALARSGTLPATRCSHTLQGTFSLDDTICLNEDGSLALTGHGTTVSVWNVKTRQWLRTLQEASSKVCSLTFSSDGLFALAGCWDSTVCIWNVQTGKRIQVLQGHTGPVEAVAIRKDKRIVLSGSQDTTVRVWDRQTGQCLRTLKGHTRRVAAVALDQDGKIAASGGHDGALRIWDVETGRSDVFQLESQSQILVGSRQNWDPKGHHGPVTSVALSADGSVVFSSGWDGTIRTWNRVSAKLLIWEAHHDHVVSLHLSTDGRLALSSGLDSMVHIWDAKTGRCLRSFQAVKKPLSLAVSTTLSGDGRWALCNTGQLQVWQIARDYSPSPLRLSQVYSSSSKQITIRNQAQQWLQESTKALAQDDRKTALELLRKIRALPDHERWSEVVSAWSAMMPVCARGKLLRIWLQDTTDDAEGRFTTASLSNDGTRAFWGNTYGRVGVHDRARGDAVYWYVQMMEKESQKDYTVRSVSISADGLLAVSGGHDHLIRIWPIGARPSGETVRGQRILQGHQDTVFATCLSADKRLVLSGSGDKTARVWDTQTGYCLRTLQGHTDSIHAVSMSADGLIAASGAFDGTVRVWNIASGACLWVLRGDKDFVCAVDVSMDGRLVISGGFEGVLKVWDVATGQCLRQFQAASSGPIHKIQLSVDQRIVLSGSEDNVIRIWDTTTGQCLQTARGNPHCVSLSADNSILFSCQGNTLTRWRLEWELEARDVVDWDEGARPTLEMFLRCHTPYAETLPAEREPSQQEIQQALTRQGAPAWNEEDFQGLLHQLRTAGYGWLRQEGVRNQLEHMASTWKTLPSLPGESRF